MVVTFTVLLVCLHLSTTEAAMASDVFRLFHDKINVNNHNIKPLINQSKTMQLNMSFSLVSITEFNEVDQRFTCNAWLDLYWTDELLQWNRSEYGGLGMVWPPNDKVWRPSLALGNIHSDDGSLAINSGIVMLKHNGLARWAPGEAFKTFCKVDISNYPLDTQRCDIEFFIWGMDLQEVYLHVFENGINMDSYKKNGEWDIIATKATERVRGSTNVMSTIVISFLLQRRSLFYILNIVMPVIVLSVLNVFVFLIPVESGEKMSYGITVLLAFGVFTSFISDKLPQTSESVCVMAVYMACLLVLSAAFVCLSIVICRIHHKDYPVPTWVSKLTLALECLACKRKSTVVAPNDDTIEKIKADVKKHQSVPTEAWNDMERVTWKRYSRALDHFCFCMFSIAILVVTCIVVIKMKICGSQITIDSVIQ